MGEGLKRRIKQSKFESPIHEAVLNLFVAANHVRELSENAVEEFGITLPQYNVLRILRGAQPNGHPRYEISARMLDRAPDVTRIIDRLEEKGLVQRDRTAQDRRHSVTKITGKGLRLLESVDPKIRAMFEEIRPRLGVRDCRELSRICELLYEDSEDRD